MFQLYIHNTNFPLKNTRETLIISDDKRLETSFLLTSKKDLPFQMKKQTLKYQKVT